MVIIGKTPKELQKSLDLLELYCDKRSLKVNINKTKIMVFRKRGPILSNEKWFYGNELLETVNKFNFLGTCILIHFV